jgi:hypothetical protein
MRRRLPPHDYLMYTKQECPFIIFRLTQIFAEIRLWGHIAFKLNRVFSKNYIPIEILSKDILVSIFIKESHYSHIFIQHAFQSILCTKFCANFTALVLTSSDHVPCGYSPHVCVVMKGHLANPSR